MTNGNYGAGRRYFHAGALRRLVWPRRPSDPVFTPHHGRGRLHADPRAAFGVSGCQVCSKPSAHSLSFHTTTGRQKIPGIILWVLRSCTLDFSNRRPWHVTWHRQHILFGGSGGEISKPPPPLNGGHDLTAGQRVWLLSSSVSPTEAHPVHT